MLTREITSYVYQYLSSGDPFQHVCGILDSEVRDRFLQDMNGASIVTFHNDIWISRHEDLAHLLRNSREARHRSFCLGCCATPAAPSLTFRFLLHLTNLAKYAS